MSPVAPADGRPSRGTRPGPCRPFADVSFHHRRGRFVSSQLCHCRHRRRRQTEGENIATQRTDTVHFQQWGDAAKENGQGRAGQDRTGHQIGLESRTETRGAPGDGEVQFPTVQRDKSMRKIVDLLLRANETQGPFRPQQFSIAGCACICIRASERNSVRHFLALLLATLSPPPRPVAGSPPPAASPPSPSRRPPALAGLPARARGPPAVPVAGVGTKGRHAQQSRFQQGGLRRHMYVSRKRKTTPASRTTFPERPSSVPDKIARTGKHFSSQHCSQRFIVYVSNHTMPLRLH